MSSPRALVRHVRRSETSCTRFPSSSAPPPMPRTKTSRDRARRRRAAGGLANAAEKIRAGERPAARRVRILAPADHEADVPAEEAQARPDPRVPGPHADSRRPFDYQAPAPQGPQAPDALAMAAGDAGARKRRRLSRSGEFDRVYREGSSHATRYWCSTASRAPMRTRREVRASGSRRPQGRRRGRAQPGQAGPARGVLGARRTGSRRARLRARRPARDRRAGRARGRRGREAASRRRSAATGGERST